MPNAIGPAWLRFALTESMGADEILLIVALVFILFLARQLPRPGEAIKERSDREQRLYNGALVVLGSLFLLAVLYAIKHAL